jgi:DNA-binding MurR/RpiR family transcriptional regulator
MNILDIVRAGMDSMTKSEARVASCFLSDPGGFAFETLDAAALRIGTSTTSVIRFCRRLGFAGYKEFQETVRAGFRNEMTLPDKFEHAVRADSWDNSLSQTAQKAVECIQQTFRDLSAPQLRAAVTHLTNAQRVFCFGMKESYALAHYAYTRFLTIRRNVFMLSAGHSGEIESILSLGEGDACIFFLFHRYTGPSPRILELLKKQGVSVILITSPPCDEVARHAAVLLPCYVNIGGIKNSFTAPVCIVDHLCNAALAASGDKALNYMENSEILFKDFTF